ncbi:hypothetical protein LZ32DRAFT_71327 [Colletotrichum eremochloae]|nr:hypothetical protein LZ32DRAFT_71327 [Colletotrichum eremochloae]
MDWQPRASHACMVRLSRTNFVRMVHVGSVCLGCFFFSLEGRQSLMGKLPLERGTPQSVSGSVLVWAKPQRRRESVALVQCSGL